MSPSLKDEGLFICPTVLLRASSETEDRCGGGVGGVGGLSGEGGCRDTEPGVACSVRLRWAVWLEQQCKQRAGGWAGPAHIDAYLTGSDLHRGV